MPLLQTERTYSQNLNWWKNWNLILTWSSWLDASQRMVMEDSFCISYEDSLAFCTHTLKGYIFKDYLYSWSALENVHVLPHFPTCTLFSIDPLFVIIEYVPFGDLLGYLRKSRGLNDTYYKDPDIKPQTNLTSEQLMKFAWQVADGMCYLSSKKVQRTEISFLECSGFWWIHLNRSFTIRD